MDTLFSEKFIMSEENESGQSYMVLELLSPRDEEIYNYQVEMLANNPRPSIVPLEIRRKNERVQFYYNISSKTPLSEFLKHRRLSKYAFVDLLLQMTGTILESDKLLLYEKNFILSEATIFIDQDKDTASIIYLPVFIAPKHCQNLKDFVLNLITKTAVIEIRHGDNFLQRIIESVKAAGFNTGDFNILLNKIKHEGSSPLYNNPQNALLGEPIDEALTQKENKKRKQFFPRSGNKSESRNYVGKYNRRMIFLGIISQLILMGMVTLFDYFTKQKLDAATRYALIGISVLIADLLIYKYVLIRKSARVGADIKRTKRVKNINLISMSKKELTNVELKRKGENKVKIKEDIKIEPQKDYEETTILYEEAKKTAFLILDDEEVTKKIEIKKDRFIIGRNSDISDLIIEEKSIGRIHAEIVNRGGEYFIIDKNSKNGTFIDNDRLTKDKEYRLINNSSIIFANKEYKFLSE